MGEASADDPISVAAQEITDLNSKINKLSDKVETQELIDIAESKYDATVAAKLARNTADMQYDAAVSTEATALQEKNAAQSAVDGQTVTVATALQDKNDAQDALDIHNQ
jgi:TolA-binding protein